MFFQIGQEVVLKYTGDKGVITQMHSDGMVMVFVKKDDMYIPVYEEDIVLLKDFKTVEKPAIEERVKPVEAEHFPVTTQYNILTSLGIQLAFEEVKRYENIEKYNIFLINDSDEEAIFVFKLKVHQKTLMEVDGKMEAFSVLSLGEMQYDDLNDAPIADFEISKITTEGLEAVKHKELKIKPQQFFKSVLMAPLLNKMVHHYIVFENLEVEKAVVKNEDLKTYTKRASQPIVTIQPPVYNPTKVTPYRSKHQLEELANFKSEIDLHIENLTTNTKGLSNSQIIAIQLSHFEQYMQTAIRLGIERVFIIHGIGKGKLRDAITTKLIQEYDIETFRNEYHPRYGFGATEVIF